METPMQVSVALEEKLMLMYSQLSDSTIHHNIKWHKNCNAIIRLLGKAMMKSDATVSSKRSLKARIKRLKSFQAMLKQHIFLGRGLSLPSEPDMGTPMQVSVALEKKMMEIYSRLSNSTIDHNIKWHKNCNATIRLLHKAMMKSDATVSSKQSLEARIGRLKSFQAMLKQEIFHGRGLGATPQDSRSCRVTWIDTESAFQGRIRTGMVVNLRHIDPKRFLADASKLVITRVKNALKKNQCVKVNTCLNGEYVLKEKYDTKSFNTANQMLLNTTDLTEWFADHVVKPISVQMEEFQERDSGWALKGLIHLTVNINRCELLNAGSYIKLPKAVSARKAVINIQNRDMACFAWAIVSALHPAAKHVDRVSSYPHYSEILNVSGIIFPMTVAQIPKFEKQNTVSINVFILANTNTNLKNPIVQPLYLTSAKKINHINLLMIHDTLSEQSHFCWIKNLSRLISQQISKVTKKKYICDRCLHVFYTAEKLSTHEIDCSQMNKTAITLPTDEEKWLKFTDFNRKESIPYIVYADFECMLNKVSRARNLDEKSYAYQQHEAYSVGYYLNCSYDNSISGYRAYRGANPAKWFVTELIKLAHAVDDVYNKPLRMNNLTPAQIEYFSKANTCHICQKVFAEGQTKVRDHCHFTGRYRGPSHQGCNLNYRDHRVIPVVFHNLTGYDAHFIIKELATAYDGHVSVLPINKEKYIAFTKAISGIRTTLRFIDSFRFLNSGLDKLASYLQTSELKILRSQFPLTNDAMFHRLTRKGVFPYDYIESVDRLNEEALPTKANFHNELNNSDVSDEDYQHAVDIWNTFEMKTLGEYSDLYLKTDVLLLADVFENFRKSSIETYNLDPAYYYTLPGFAWDAMLKHTKVRLELLTDIDMVLYVERGIRGGLTQCSNRYGSANNKYMSTYDASKPDKYLMYYDVNNLYGWAMSQYLPTEQFKWVIQVSQFDVTAIPDDSSTGYILEVDLEYPQELHDHHKDLPFCPHHDNAPNTKDLKLLATLHGKKRYVIHYRSLKQCLAHGLKLTKIHRILQFKQSPWLKSYIDLNTNLRTQAKNEFEKNLFKLMNNAVFGKTMENVRNHVNIKLVTQWLGKHGARTLIAQPNFHRRTIFNENFMAIEMRKLSVKFFKPIYVGMCILDLSKTVVYEFHYDYMLKNFNCKLLYTDTDSLIYEILDDDIYEAMKRDIHRFDTSDYEDSNPYDMPRVNKKVIGLMKDENGGLIVIKFVGLGAKMYAFLVDGREIKKAKGIKTSIVQDDLSVKHYLECLSSGSELTVEQRTIRSKLHEVFSMCETKIALSADDTKRYIIPDSTDTYPWGHKSIPEDYNYGMDVG